MSGKDGKEESQEQNVSEENDKDVTAKIDELLHSITEGLKSRAQHYKLTKPFAEKGVITRTDLLLLGTLVASYDALEEIDTKLAVDHVNWLSICGQTAEELEDVQHKFSPSTFTALLAQYCEVSDKVEAQFLKILEQFADKKEVKTHLLRFQNMKKVGSDLEQISNFSGSVKGSENEKARLEELREKVILVQEVL